MTHTSVQKMFTYPNGQMRFISDVNLEVNDEIQIGLNAQNMPVFATVKSIEDQRQDIGNWIKPKITQKITY